MTIPDISDPFYAARYDTEVNDEKGNIQASAKGGSHSRINVSGIAHIPAVDTFDDIHNPEGDDETPPEGDGDETPPEG